MIDTIYSAMEFYGQGDPYFGGTAADWALYKTEDGGHAFVGAADAQRRKFVMAISRPKPRTPLRLRPKIVCAIRRRGPQHELQERKLSRYTVQITNGTTTDEEGTIGYDRPLRTFFLQAFPDPDPTNALFGWARSLRNIRLWNPSSRPPGREATRSVA